MAIAESDLLENIRQQFDQAPYPAIPLDHSPKEDTNRLFTHNLVTPFYLRNQQIISTEGLTILDIGCGNGYTSHILAEANPGAKIVGIDLSEVSIDLARERLKYHNFPNVEFHAIPVEAVPALGLTFDYINCDEVLYILPDLIQALKVLKSVLKPHGILRGNLHSFYQRMHYFKAQKLFKLMGLMDVSPGDLEVETALETMRALKDDVPLKLQTWTPEFETANAFGKAITNYLLLGDKGFTIPDLFNALRATDLEFVSMVNWNQWDLMQVFKDPNNLPFFWEMSLPDLSPETQLEIFELLYPAHRLLDFWCGNPGQAIPFTPPHQWQPDDWQQVRVSLHPQLQTDAVREALIACVNNQQLFTISRQLSAPTMTPVGIDSTMAACLLPLWEQPQSVPVLVDRLLTIRPLNPATLEPISQEQAFAEIQGMLINLEMLLYVLLERRTEG